MRRNVSPAVAHLLPPPLPQTYRTPGAARTYGRKQGVRRMEAGTCRRPLAEMPATNQSVGGSAMAAVLENPRPTTPPVPPLPQRPAPAADSAADRFILELEDQSPPVPPTPPTPLTQPTSPTPPTQPTSPTPPTQPTAPTAPIDEIFLVLAEVQRRKSRGARRVGLHRKQLLCQPRSALQHTDIVDELFELPRQISREPSASRRQSRFA
ncbi:hypothetical protein GGI07_001908 [Coemansia sp. Benny D115]|nr:hypothetical protein GGI07_001908 [Coemansia sp. Benny D115]